MVSIACIKEIYVCTLLPFRYVCICLNVIHLLFFKDNDTMPRLFDPQVTRLRGTEYFIHF